MVCPAPMPERTCPRRFQSGNTIMRLLPIDEISLSIIVEAPFPIARTAMTAGDAEAIKEELGYRVKYVSPAVNVSSQLVRQN